MPNTMIQGRQADSARRRQRVIKELDAAREAGRDLSVSAIARAAGVDRTFLYRHPDLLAQLHAAQAAPIPNDEGGAPVTMVSLKADLLNAQARIARLASHNKQLERKLSELLGEGAWRESGLGAPADIDHLQRQVTTLEQQVIGLRAEIEERDQELQAARAANRELFANMNKQH
ncbi:DUF6262 family protein [Rhodococcus sp. IEGM 1307]|uniref:DUF6262 family protein n=1 Tax=Rhodococcus sp. IEGM 1307 TaxID=3047091 RepID=UPI0013C151A7|nr:DUF6262 family protein [Rhodococcus sp. IEGM 1307]MDI9980020.1 DUF6262 family protein [Rhodococcus sp. IEGM 1307]NDV08693.1 hypothetical protein [Rhodococcus sp. IEGM 248]